VGVENAYTCLKIIRLMAENQPFSGGFSAALSGLYPKTAIIGNAITQTAPIDY
jgi:hypothetical protein